MIDEEPIEVRIGCNLCSPSDENVVEYTQNINKIFTTSFKEKKQNFLYRLTMTQVVKKNLSKKTKKSWRKIEHPDVENYLEDQRLEERIG